MEHNPKRIEGTASGGSKSRRGKTIKREDQWVRNQTRGGIDCWKGGHEGGRAWRRKARGEAPWDPLVDGPGGDPEGLADGKRMFPKKGEKRLSEEERMSARVAGGKGYWHRFMAGEGVGANAVRDRHHGGVWQERRREGEGVESQGGSRGAARGTAGWRSHRGGCRTHHSMRILEGRGSRPRHGPAAAGPPQPGSGKGTGGRAPGGSSQQRGPGASRRCGGRGRGEG